MNNLTIGDILQNSVQQVIVRWIGSVGEIPMIGLQLIDSTLPGYTDGTCPFDNKHYFNCPHGQGYYILKIAAVGCYDIVLKKGETNRLTSSDDEFNSAEQSLSTSPSNIPISPQPILPSSLPFTTENQPCSDNNPVISSPRGVLSRLAFEREQRKVQVSPSSPSKTTLVQTSSTESDPPSRIYRPENYKSTSYDKTEESEIQDSDDDTENNFSLPQITNNTNRVLPVPHLPSFGHEYFLDTWTLGRVNSFLERQIPMDNQLCLNIYINQCNAQILIDEQINGCLSLIPNTPPIDVRIELIKLFDHVETIFPSRAIRLYDNDYLLLAILCSNNQCAYIRTTTGWAYTDDESDHGESFVVDEISQMIDDFNSDIQHNSEQCRHVLKNAAFLYYKLVE